ncbi:hypothetical protein EXIGLDRAFT_731969 [Exidia glandulosa HHB12029]|uniref:Uncharacterized protein n=1 Tax=Exidia glandulosa HHB12029 TaxID=1314781 RepID=A0A165BPB4_EXIGL|nr:hypothetical protein EXIGLDRAFT_731969 [Exidia glandulosa HHB12029]
MKHGLLSLVQWPLRRVLLPSFRRLAHIGQLDPFGPSTSVHATSSPSASTRPVTLPALPELHDPNFLDALLPRSSHVVDRPETSAAPPADAFVDALHDTANLVRTANMAFAHASSGSACLDAFSGLNSYTSTTEYDSILSKSWTEDPLKTLRIIWHLRSIHEGQSANEAFYRAFAWLYLKHPRTAILNLSQLVEPVIELPARNETDHPRTRAHGYYKDLLNILVLATNAELTPTARHKSLHVPRIRSKVAYRYRQGRKHSKRRLPPETRDARVQAGVEHNNAVTLAARRARERTAVERAAHVRQLLATDPTYKALFVAVARIFADGISRDVETLRTISDPLTSDEERVSLSFSLSYAAKWAPSVSAMHDKHTNIATAIAELLYIRGALVKPNPALPTPLTHEDAHRVRGMYTRWALSPLRRAKKVPETYMGTQRWGDIDYSHVPSKCMSVNAKHFHEHDHERFSQYLQEVAQGHKTISGATLLPHELLAAAMSPSEDFERQVIDAQWNTMVQNIRDAGKLDNCLAVCDVSGSMGDLKSESHLRGIYPGRPWPIVPAVALSLVLAQTAREPWRNCFITFSGNPEIVRLDPSAGLAKTAQQIATSSWNMNTDFNAVFTRLILPMAERHKLQPDDMIKRLFVFSDMEFDRSCSSLLKKPWATEHEIIKANFERLGYTMPEIVYWNLWDDSSQPVTGGVAGTALVTGFSPNLMKLFMEGDDLIVEPETEMLAPAVREPMDPFAIMDKALSRPSFSGLRVVD